MLHQNKTDEWLTPLNLIKALGQFDTDPCCALKMPWKTAKRMYTKKDNGLEQPWIGRVWLNPPYSNCKPWIEALVEHSNGIALVSAKSIDAKWGQLALSTCDCVLFLAGRILFYYPDGTESTGKWLSNMLLAYGSDNVKALKQIINKYPGVLMRRINEDH